MCCAVKTVSSPAATHHPFIVTVTSFWEHILLGDGRTGSMLTAAARALHERSSVVAKNLLSCSIYYSIMYCILFNLELCRIYNGSV